MKEYPNLKKFTSETAREAGRKGGTNKKGSVHISTRIQKMMSDENFQQKLKDGSVIKGEPMEAILKVAIAKARGGDIRFLEWLAKYGWGQKVDITSDGEKLQPNILEVIDAVYGVRKEDAGESE